MANGIDDPKIGVALSGGGARAMAFHLGCLRTLDRLGVLQRARVLSTVSGGSVIGAMYALHEGTFEEFEQRVRAVLQTGFAGSAIRVAATTLDGPRAVASWAWLVLSWFWLSPFRVPGKVSRLIAAARGQRVVGVAPGERWVPHRFASRTTILRRTFDELLFRGATLGALPDGRPKLITVAAELRTGSAYYFSKGGAGTYRLGPVDPTRIPVAQAVAASAAYPLLLPALDEYVTCRKRDGSLRRERIALTDGGVYDNLGLAPLWPDRDPKVSIAVEPVDFIVACRAGYGRRVGEPSQFMLSRMGAAFECVFNRAQNHATKRLYDLKQSGRLKGFVLPYLDQDDSVLACPPADLLRREAVADYPTDFFAMPLDWIEKLSKRGEQLTLAVIEEHAPELLRIGGRDLVGASDTASA